MLNYIYELLKPYHGSFNTINSLTFRAVMAGITAFFIGILLGKRIIRILRHLQLGDKVEKTFSDNLRKLHQKKSGTPTMGGIIIIVSVIISVLLWARLDNFYLILAVLSMVLFGAVGFWDDAVKCFSKQKGLSGKKKLVLLSCVALLLVALLWLYIATDFERLRLFFPFFKNFQPALTIGGGFLFILWAILVIVGSSNAVNLTDGLDGLAIGCSVMVGSVFTVIAFLAGKQETSCYLLIPYVPGAGELAIFSSSLVGSGLAFLWYNCHPAEIFMGDTGSLTIGGALGYIAIALRQEFLLLILGGVFVIETLSVMLQVGSFKLIHKRIFKIAPLHHHFEFKGLDESKITVRFWILNAMFILIAVVSINLTFA